MVRYLAGEHNTDVNVKNKLGYTALINAAKQGHLDVVRCLVYDHRGDVNATRNDGYTALMKAAALNHMDVVRYLANAPTIHVNYKNSNGKSAIGYAAKEGSHEMLQLLTCLAEVPAESQQPDSSKIFLTHSTFRKWQCRW